MLYIARKLNRRFIMEMPWMSSPYWDATVEYLDVLEDSGSNWCICNTKLP